MSSRRAPDIKLVQRVSHPYIICPRYWKQIDYVITRKNLRTEITDSRSYHGTSLNSDHRIVICDTKIEWRRVYKQNKADSIKSTRLDVDKLKDSNIREQYNKSMSKNLNTATHTHFTWRELVKL